MESASEPSEKLPPVKVEESPTSTSEPKIRYEYNEISFGNGNIYHGDIKIINDKEFLMDGKGILYYPSGDYYVGDFKEDKKEGFGMFYTEETKNYIIGQFSNDMINGLGIYHFINKGDLYKGEFKNDMMEGYGEYYYSDGNIYKGQFKDNKFILIINFKKNSKSIFFIINIISFVSFILSFIIHNTNSIFNIIFIKSFMPITITKNIFTDSAHFIII